jgi:hypothetical protein
MAYGEAVSERDTVLARVQQLLADRGTMYQPYGRGSLWTHLLGTFNILEQWGESVAICAAGLLHHAYASSLVDHPIFSEQERGTVKSAVGDRAEALLFDFAQLDQAVLSAIYAGDDLSEVPLLRGSASRGEVALANLRDIFVVIAAHRAEGSACASGAPTAWLSDLSHTAAALKRHGILLPDALSQIADCCLGSTETRVINAYAAAANSKTLDPTVFAELEAASATLPPIAEPSVLLGLRALAGSDLVTASRMGNRAAEAMILWNTPWDKRLSVSQWMDIAELLVGMDRSEPGHSDVIVSLVDTVMRTAPYPEALYCRLHALGAFETPDDSVVPQEDAVASTPSDLTDADFEELPARFVEFICNLRENEPLLDFYPDLREQPWWDGSEFSLTSALEGIASSIIDEYQSIPETMYRENSELMPPTPGIRACVLASNGLTNEHDPAPLTVTTIERHRIMRGAHGSVAFMRLAPGTTVPVQHGPTNLRIRCHFGLDVPGSAELIVNGITKPWREGRCLMFDDSFPHELLNAGERECALLVVDLWHPDLTDDEVMLLQGLQRYRARRLERFDTMELTNH